MQKKAGKGQREGKAPQGTNKSPNRNSGPWRNSQLYEDYISSFNSPSYIKLIGSILYYNSFLQCNLWEQDRYTHKVLLDFLKYAKRRLEGSLAEYCINACWMMDVNNGIIHCGHWMIRDISDDVFQDKGK